MKMLFWLYALPLYAFRLALLLRFVSVVCVFAEKYSGFLVVGGPETQFTKFMFVYLDLGFGGARSLVAVCALNVS